MKAVYQKQREIFILDKIAIITLDTYSAKLIIAGSNKPDTFSVLDKEVEQINLGLEQEDHFLKKPQIALWVFMVSCQVRQRAHLSNLSLDNLEISVTLLMWLQQ